MLKDVNTRQRWRPNSNASDEAHTAQVLMSARGRPGWTGWYDATGQKVTPGMPQVRRNAVDTVYYPAAQGVSLSAEREKHVDCKPPMFILVNFRCI